MSATRSRVDVVRAIEATGVVGVIRLPDASQLRAVAEALLQGGVRTLEVTMTVPRAVTLIDLRFTPVNVGEWAGGLQFIQATLSRRRTSGRARSWRSA